MTWYGPYDTIQVKYVYATQTLPEFEQFAKEKQQWRTNLFAFMISAGLSMALTGVLVYYLVNLRHQKESHEQKTHHSAYIYNKKASAMVGVASEDSEDNHEHISSQGNDQSYKHGPRDDQLSKKDSNDDQSNENELDDDFLNKKDSSNKKSSLGKKISNETTTENITDQALAHKKNVDERANHGTGTNDQTTNAAFENAIIQDKKTNQGSLQATKENNETKETAQTQQTKKSDETKRHVMKALSPNEALIVEIMIQKEGAIRRNELEKQTKLAKSSLASSLYNLEKRNIVIVDKTNVVHFVKFTEWFNNL